MDDLPPELIYIILQVLGYRQRCAIKRVCPIWLFLIRCMEQDKNKIWNSDILLTKTTYEGKLKNNCISCNYGIIIEVSDKNIASCCCSIPCNIITDYYDHMYPEYISPITYRNLINDNTDIEYIIFYRNNKIICGYSCESPKCYIEYDDHYSELRPRSKHLENVLKLDPSDVIPYNSFKFMGCALSIHDRYASFTGTIINSSLGNMIGVGTQDYFNVFDTCTGIYKCIDRVSNKPSDYCIVANNGRYAITRRLLDNNDRIIIRNPHGPTLELTNIIFDMKFSGSGSRIMLIVAISYSIIAMVDWNLETNKIKTLTKLDSGYYVYNYIPTFIDERYSYVNLRYTLFGNYSLCETKIVRAFENNLIIWDLDNDVICNVDTILSPYTNVYFSLCGTSILLEEYKKITIYNIKELG